MELTDVYDNNRQIIRKNDPRKSNLKEGEHKLFVFLCLFNQEGKMLVQKRAKNKQIFGGYWEFSAGGGTLSGESSYQAIQRETMEELGFNYKSKYPKPFISLNLRNFICDYYVSECNWNISQFQFDKNEIDEIRWMTKEEIYEAVDSNSFIPYYKSLIDLLFSTRKTPYTRLSDQSLI
ncbi:NUDIX family hydrolase [Mycoplasmopsis californica]|uniref:NUDIX family hydrolase n=1 Tax=Mycoplasmopsis californica TaxID=2113 RepID=A0A059XWU5_9BACT|nr:NUDIX domain-containing protein [Mycoplasmopsis californica]AIA29751.1 NUDIX family hydrolase [Mycoplasmopsis californica]